MKKDFVYKDSNALLKQIHRGYYPELYNRPDYPTDKHYSDYVNTYIDRDVSEIINMKDKLKFHNFMQVLASMTSQQIIIVPYQCPFVHVDSFVFQRLLAKAVKGATNLSLGAGGFIHGIHLLSQPRKAGYFSFHTPSTKRIWKLSKIAPEFSKKV